MIETVSNTHLEIYFKSLSRFLISVEIDKKEDSKKSDKKHEPKRNRRKKG